MSRLSWETLERIYRDAQGGDSRNWLTLQNEMQERPDRDFVDASARIAIDSRDIVVQFHEGELIGVKPPWLRHGGEGLCETV